MKHLKIYLAALPGILFTVPSAKAQITITSKTHSPTQTLVVSAASNMISNGSFETLPAVHQIQTSPGSDAQKWYSAWSTPCPDNIPGWSSSTPSDAYGVVGPTIPNGLRGSFANMSNFQDCNNPALQYYSGGTSGTDQSGQSTVNITTCLDGSNMLYMGLGEGWLLDAPDPSFNPGTGEIYPPGKYLLQMGTDSASIQQTVSIISGKDYLLEFGTTGEGNDADGFIRVDIGPETLWFAVPGVRGDHFSSLSRFFRIAFSATATANIDIKFTSYGHISKIAGVTFDTPAWQAWFAGAGNDVAIEPFLDAITLVDMATLPIKIETFDAKMPDCRTANLSWKVGEAETQGGSLDVMYSTDGVTFTTIYSSPTTPDNIRKSINLPLASNASRNYFRLVTTDANQRKTYSNIVMLQGCTGKPVVVIYPNPGSGFIKVSYSAPGGELPVAVLYDMMGKTVLTKYLKAGETVIDVSKLAKGIYNLGVYNSRGEYIQNKTVVIN